jgi:hypothetical protein
VLFTEGDHVPEMLLLEVAGSVNVPPEQIAGICVKVGVIDEEVPFSVYVAVLVLRQPKMEELTVTV